MAELSSIPRGLRLIRNPPAFRGFPPWCYGSPAGCACPAPCTPRALWVRRRVHRIYRGFVSLNLMHASSFLLLDPPFCSKARFSAPTFSLSVVGNPTRSHAIFFVPVLTMVPVKLLRPPPSPSASPVAPPAPLSFAPLALASFANSSFLGCSTSSISALSFLIFHLASQLPLLRSMSPRAESLLPYAPAVDPLYYHC